MSGIATQLARVPDAEIVAAVALHVAEQRPYPAKAKRDLCRPAVVSRVAQELIASAHAGIGLAVAVDIA